MRKIRLILLAGLITLIACTEVLADHDLRNGEWRTVVGVVEKMPIGLYGVWIIDGRSILVTPQSRVDQSRSLAAKGSYAAVTGIARGGSFHATTLAIAPVANPKVADGRDHQHRNGFFQGKINDLPQARIGYWLIDGHRVLVDKLTRIEEALGRAIAGALVRVEGYYRNNTFYAQVVRVK